MPQMIDIPDVACGSGLHHQDPSSDPVFHFVEPGGRHGVAGLGTAKMWARSMWEDRIHLHEFVSDLYILLPGSPKMVHCTICISDYTEGRERPEMEVEALKPTVLSSNVLYVCRI